MQNICIRMLFELMIFAKKLEMDLKCTVSGKKPTNDGNICEWKKKFKIQSLFSVKPFKQPKINDTFLIASKLISIFIKRFWYFARARVCLCVCLREHILHHWSKQQQRWLFVQIWQHRLINEHQFNRKFEIINCFAIISLIM